MHTVKKINFIDGYKLSLTFNDKITKIVDLEGYLKKGIFLPVRDPDYFNRVKVVGSTIAWPNGADFCPDVLYEIGEEVKEIKRGPIKRTRYSTSASRKGKGKISASSSSRSSA